MAKQNNHNKKEKPQKAPQDAVVLDFENPPPIPQMELPAKKAKKNTRPPSKSTGEPKPKVEKKEELMNDVKEEAEPTQQIVKRKRNPPHFKLKTTIIDHLQQKEIDEAITQQIKDLFGLK